MNDFYDPNEWIKDLEAEFESTDFELVPTPYEAKSSKPCSRGIHFKNTTPISLPEKQFEQFYVCRYCGKAMSKANR